MVTDGDGYNTIPRDSLGRVRFRAIDALTPEPVRQVVYRAVCGEGFGHTGIERRRRPRRLIPGRKFPAPACQSYTFQGS
jgi:hypothetical protein